MTVELCPLLVLEGPPVLTAKAEKFYRRLKKDFGQVVLVKQPLEDKADKAAKALAVQDRLLAQRRGKEGGKVRLRS